MRNLRDTSESPSGPRSREAKAARKFLQAWTLFFTVDCLRVRTQQDILPSHIPGDLMGRDLQDAREAVEPQQVQANRRRRKCYLGCHIKKKVTLSECNRML